MDYQQQQEYLGSSYFQPIHSDLSYESYEEEQTFAEESFNKSIFRQPEEADGFKSPPTVLRANPIAMEEDDDEYLYCDHEESIYNVISPYPYAQSQEELKDRQELVSEMPQLASPTVDYSFYFEASSPRSVWGNEISPSLSTQAEACAMEQLRMGSPAQISDTDSMGEEN